MNINLLSPSKPTKKFNVTLLKKLMLLLIVCGSVNVSAQVSAYTNEQLPLGAFYAPLDNITKNEIITGAWDNTVVPNVSIGFPFTFNSNTYTTLNVSSNGFVTFGAAPTTTNYTPIANTEGAGVIAGLAADWKIGTASFDTEAVPNQINSISTFLDTSNGAGNYIFIVEYRAVSKTGTDGPISFQIRLNQLNNVVEVHYATQAGNLTATTTTQVGLRGTATTDVNSLVWTGTNWPSGATVMAQGTSTSTVRIVSAGIRIATTSDRLFRWTPAGCSAPTGLSVSNVAASTANVSWTALASATSGYQYYISSNSTVPTAATTPTGLAATNSLNLTGLAGNTTYYIYVRSDCGGSTSAWTSAVTFTTLCTAVNIPYFLYMDLFTDNFTIPGIPECTTRETITGTPWATETAASGDGTFFDEHLVYNASGTQAANSWFYTRGINLVAGETYRVSYTYGGSTNLTTITNKLKVAFGTAPNNSSMTTTLADHPNIKESPVVNVVNFTATTTGTFYFGFQAYSAMNMGKLFLDNIEIVESICLRPVTPTITAIGYNSATASWTAPNPAPAGGYSYYISTSSIPPNYATAATGTTAPGITSVNLTGLSGSTQYYFWVRGNCGSPDNSEWSPVASFLTTATPPYCIPPAVTDTTSPILNVTTTNAVTNINNSSAYVAPGYSDYTNMLITESQNGTFNFSIGFNAAGGVGVAIYIDYNGDGDFLDAGELAYNSATYLYTSPITGSITVPAGATLGTTRMRVVADYWATNPGPCAIALNGTTRRGEIEDYSFKIVVPPPALTISPLTSTQCAGANSTLITLTSPIGNYNVYTWSPSTGVTGNATTGWTIASGTSLTYTLTGTQTSGAMSINTVQFNYTALPLPTPITITASSGGVYCQDSTTPVTLTASGGVVSGVPVYSETFNNGDGGWTRHNLGSTGNVAAAAWTVRPDGFNPTGPSWGSTILHSNDNTAFFFSDADAQGSGNINNIKLVSPSFSLAGYTAASLSFWHYYRSWTPSTASVEISMNSTDGLNGTWTLLPPTYTNTTQGTPTAWVNVVHNLPASFLVPSATNVRVRFNYVATWGWGWGIDNFVISGSATSSITWSPAAGLYTSPTMAPGTAYVAGAGAQVVYAAPGSTQVYTASASTPAPTVCSTSTATTVTVTPVGGGTISPAAQTVCGAPTALTLTGVTGTVTGWQYSTTSNFAAFTNIPSSASTTLSSAQIGTFAGTRYFRAVVTNGGCTNYVPTIASGTTISVTYSSTTWDGTTWNPAAPNNSTAAIFAGNYTGTANLSACSVTVNSGNVTFNSGVTLTVVNGVTVNGGSLNFLDDASLVQINDAAVNVNNASVTYKRQTTTMENYDYTYWSSPLYPQTLLGVSPLTMADKYFRFDTAANNYVSVPANNLMDPAKGYIIRAPQNWATGQYTATFTGGAANNGVPNNGVFNAPIVLAGANNFNLLGNPYPSAIDADLFYAANSGLIQGSFYFWTHNTPIDPLQYDGDDYAIWNSTGGVGTAGGGTGNSTPPNGNIAAGQGFFVKSIASGSAVFNNSMRLVGLNNVFYRTSESATPQALERHRVWVEIKNNDGAYKQALVGYIETATNENDIRFDGDLVDAGNVVGLYSVLGDASLAIQGRALPFEVNDQVPMGYKTTIAGSFEIALSNFDGLFVDQGIYLEDKLLNIIHDLKGGSYSFTTEAGTFNDRFLLRYTDGAALANNDLTANENKVVVFKNDSGININSSNMIMSSVKVLDIRGRLVHQKNNINSTTTVLSNLNIQEGVLVIQITLEDGQIVNKKIIF